MKLKFNLKKKQEEVVAENNSSDKNFVVEDIDISYGFNKRIIKDLTFEVNKGDFLSVLGPNGAGKSTLIKALCRIQPPSKGSILFEGKLVRKEHPISFYPRLFGMYFKKYTSFMESEQKIQKNISKWTQKIAAIESNEHYKPTNIFQKFQVALTFNKAKKQEWIDFYKEENIGKLNKKICYAESMKNITEIIDKEKKYFKENRNLKAFTSTELAKRLAYVPQILDFPRDIKVYDFVKLGRFPHQKLGMNPKKENEIIMNALDIVEMTNFSNTYLEDLSGGQQQRCLIAMALAQDTDTIVLDEPTNHLDIKSQLEIVDLLHMLNHKYHKTIILVIHDLNYSIRYANKLLVLQHGEKVAFGNVYDVMTEDLVKNFFGVNSKISLNERGKKYIEYSWLDNEYDSTLDLKDLKSKLESTALLSKQAREKLSEIDSLLLKEQLTQEEHDLLRNKIFKKFNLLTE
ncbi:ABC transporter ATP-binding protein [Ureaplasma ceti]|uniref:ABC transporter domain-containing protein n=1 Tax=Ureaplasma ceti TaxID=3119530 RepID=A0ABP9U7D9_9BACT